MSPLEELIARQRNALLRIETNGASKIVKAYKRVEDTLRENLTLLTDEIETARAANIEVRPGWMFAQARYHELIGQLQTETLAFLHSAIKTVVDAQEAAVDRAPTDAEALVFAALGPAPKQAMVQVKADFARFPAGAFRGLVGYAGDGEPLGNLLAEIAPSSAQAVKNSLAYGVATGQNPRVIADDVVVQSGMSRTRALAISRTETLRAYRTATNQRFQQTGIVAEWTWVAALDKRTCPSCAAMNGTTHPVTEPLASHPNCRCTQVPITPSWADLGFPDVPDERPAIGSPEEQFAALPVADQRSILGKPRYEALAAGHVDLADMSQETNSERWGPGRQQATLQQLGIGI